MKDLILKLAEFTAPSGSESTIMDTLLGLVKDVADEVFVDTLGNGIAKKAGKGSHVVLTAHADQAGVMVIHIEEEGFLRIIPVGNLLASSLVGQHILFTNGVRGLIGVESKVKVEDISFDDLYVDIGAGSIEEANSRVKIGLSGVVAQGVFSMDEYKLAGQGLDNRVGCAIAAEAFRQAAAAGYQVSLVFTSQQTVGARGAQTAAFQLRPDVAFVIDAAPAGDMPKADRMELKLGHGPAIKIMDGTAIVPLKVKDHLIEAAKSAGIEVQYEVWPRGLSDAGSFQLSVDGINVGGVSYPARYVGSSSTVVDVRDAENAVKLLVEAIRAF